MSYVQGYERQEQYMVSSNLQGTKQFVPKDRWQYHINRTVLNPGQYSLVIRD